MRKIFPQFKIFMKSYFNLGKIFIRKKITDVESPVLIYFAATWGGAGRAGGSAAGTTGRRSAAGAPRAIEKIIQTCILDGCCRKKLIACE